MSSTQHQTTLEARASALGAEWARLPRAGERLEGLSRSFIYELIQANKIRSHVIKKPHAVKGIRLVYLPALRAFIAAQVSEANPEIAA